MIQFFDYFATCFDWSQGFIGVRDGTSRAPSPQFARGGRGRQSSAGSLFVQDWLDSNNNAARALDERGKKRVIQVDFSHKFPLKCDYFIAPKPSPNVLFVNMSQATILCVRLISSCFDESRWRV
jgi:hypothetical protein